MNIDSPPHVDTPPELSRKRQTSSSTSISKSKSSPATEHAARPRASEQRTLRARPSDPPPPSLPGSSPTATKAKIRSASQNELASIQKRLGPEGVQLRREELLKENERKLKSVVDGHDAAVREKFHLEKFVSLLEGWDPEVSCGSAIRFYARSGSCNADKSGGEEGQLSSLPRGTYQKP